MRLYGRKRYLGLNKSTLPTSIIEDLLGEEIKGKFYKEQVQKVQLPTSLIVDKIHRRRKRNGGWWIELNRPFHCDANSLATKTCG